MINEAGTSVESDKDAYNIFGASSVTRSKITWAKEEFKARSPLISQSSVNMPTRDPHE